MALITSHPTDLLAYYPVLHSHSNPARWVSDPEFANNPKLASLRNPIGTLCSACFSINALTSDYIQQHLAPDEDNDALREKLA